jgi:serine protease Do
MTTSPERGDVFEVVRMTRVTVFAIAAALSLAGTFFVGRELGRRGRAPADAYRIQRESAFAAERALRTAPPGSGAIGHAHLETTGAFVRVAERLKPSVVTIQCALPNGGRSGGSGVVMTADGAILTNNHVVQDATEITVELSSYDVYVARLVGSDTATDLALLKIDVPSELLPATFGDSDDLRVGEEVTAIGNALDFGWTVTHGIVSSLHRSNLVTGHPNQYTDYIQTDAAINPGNSGGPLANLKGEVIGINVAVLAKRADGIGFAIPANDAKFVANGLLKNGYVTRGYLGMTSDGASFRELSNAQRKKLGSGVTGGALVTKVVQRTPAAAAGFLTGDFIYALDGRSVEDYEVLRNRIARLSPGSTINVSIRRGGEDRVVRATIGERPPGG